MKRHVFGALLISCAVLTPNFMFAEPVAEPAAEPEPAPVAEAVAEPEAAPQPAKELSGWEKVLSKLPKVSGYLQSGWNWTKTSADGAKASNSFQAKRLRLIVDGNVGEKVDFRLQIEAFNGIAGSTNGNGQKNIQVMDAFATWKIMPEFKVRVGQFYTPLGYENYDISPATLETVDFSNIVYRMACRNPYEYNFVDYGRDLGIMVLGDAFDSGEGFRYLHYDFAVTNGSIPCKDDSNKTKDVYASVTIRPFKNFNIKGTYNYGEYESKALAGGTGVAPVTASGKYNPMNRFVVGAWYNDPNGLDIRAEYGRIHSSAQGRTAIKETGAYALIGYHAGKFLPIVRWDLYRDSVNKTSGNNYNRILIGCTYQLFKNVKLQFNYGHYMYMDEFETANGYKGNNQIQIMGLFKF